MQLVPESIVALRRIKARWIPAFAGMTLMGCSATPLPATDRIVSTNPCLDAILVELVPVERIAAISHYSRDPRSTSMPLPLARRLGTTSGTAEEVIALRPGLVLASSFTAPATLGAYQRLGLEVARFPIASTLEENRAQIRAIAQAVGARERGEALVARIDRAVGAAEPRDARRPLALLWLGGSNLVNGQGTLIDELLGKAGFQNASAAYGVRFTGVLPLEHVVAHPPDVVMTPVSRAGADEDARRASLRMRALRGKAVVADFPPNLFYCGGPSIVPAMARLVAMRRQVAR
jgi:iron complex transport system substrate-binding protein